MTPAARLSAAADVLDTLEASGLVDPKLKAWARRNRFAGAGDRRAIADHVYTCLRMRLSSAALGGGLEGRALVLGSLVTDQGLSAAEIEALCSGGYGLDGLSDNERNALQTPIDTLPEDKRLDWPEWLLPEAKTAFGSEYCTELGALRHRAPLDLRVNLLKGTVADAQKRLKIEGFDAQKVSICETALRLPPATRIQNSSAIRTGHVEPQDAASQAVAVFSLAKPGDTVLDYCAGAGGKTVALAAIMKNDGYLIAHDVEPKRMRDLPARAEKCGVQIIQRKSRSQLEQAACDAVLVDAPCSGSGSWRRDPMGKWRLTPERLKSLHGFQREAMENAAGYVRPGGLLTYATCSVLPSENAAQVEWFLNQNADFTLEDTLNLWPARDDCDGFFAARFKRIDNEAHG